MLSYYDDALAVVCVLLPNPYLSVCIFHYIHILGECVVVCIFAKGVLVFKATSLRKGSLPLGYTVAVAEAYNCNRYTQLYYLKMQKKIKKYIYLSQFGSQSHPYFYLDPPHTPRPWRPHLYTHTY